ncbi:MAG TPA: tetratricopeptide repeat protein [Allosphingosinicella sp.]|jgi:tetratricopeptide (TPR) repeat protein
MLARAALFLAASLAVGAPAGAAVTVIGSNAARRCYEAADAPFAARPETMALCDQALAGPPLSARDLIATYVNRGILRVRSGDLAGGIEDFDAAIARDPNVAEAWFNRGVALLRTRGAAAALPSFDQAVERGTAQPALAYFGRAVALEALGDVRRAYADYRRASELDPAWDRPRAELARFQVRGN